MVDFHIFRNKQVSLSICLIVTAVFMIGCTAAGCSKGPATSITSTKTAVATSATTAKSETQPTNKTSVSTTKATTTTTTVKTVSTDPFTRLEDTLDDMDVYFEKKWMAAEMIGAKEGYKYATYSGTFELYLFDTVSDAYQAAIKNNAISLSGTLYPAYIKNGFAIYFYDNATSDLKTKIKGILFP